jgi:hypothetical protein
MRFTCLVLTFAVLLPLTAAAQDEQASASGSASQSASANAKSQEKSEAPRASVPIAVRTNVRVDLTISDQTGNGPVEKKQVTLIAAEATWGKIRTNAATKPADLTAGPFVPIRLNVDARPFLTASGAIQLELTIDYNPTAPIPREASQIRPTEINQSMTIVLQSGKSMVISQAADPVTDRKIIVEVVATILK